MCGIAGYASCSALDNSSVSAAMQSALQSLHHRGPDDRGYELHEHVALGHTRLSIIDLSSSGHQPMASGDGKVWIVFNGEIYNFMALRNRLQQKGYEFNSHTDTEVLIHGYREWGMDGLLQRINGMFAFALHDTDSGRLVLARDHFGIKPLYYSTRDNSILFASEPKAMLAFEGSRPQIDITGLVLSLQHIGIPDDHGIFQGIEQLPPGTLLTFDYVSGKVDRQRYWQWQWQPDISSHEQAEKQVWEALCQSVEQQLTADVPVGIFLSGGLDSSLLAAACAENGYKPDCFTIALPESSQDESVFARSVCEHFGLPHTIEVMSADDAMPFDADLAAIYDEPFASSAALSACHISRMAAKHFKVILSGDGGDELFSGYRWYAKWLKQYGEDGNGGSVLARMTNRLKNTIGMKTDPLDGYAQMLGSYSDSDMASVFGKSVLDAAADLAHGGSIYHRYDDPGLKGMDRLQLLDINLFLSAVCLRKMDRASMHHSLEVRVPFLDLLLADVASRLPSHLRTPNGELKGLLRNLARKKLPADVAEKKKKGFSTPIGKWFAAQDIIASIEKDMATFDSWQQWFHPSLIKNLSRFNGRALWRIWHTWRWVRNNH